MLCGNISDPMILENQSRGKTFSAEGKKDREKTCVVFSPKEKRSSTDQRGASLT
jgi:hypothetical protein